MHHFFTSRHKNPIPRDSGRQSGDREAAGRQAKPGRETAEEAGRPRRSPVVGRAGERRTVEFTLPARAFSYYSEAESRWVEDPGLYTIEAAVSSRDIRSTAQIEIK